VSDCPPRVACIVGPTASGKSALADLVAYELGSAVVSCDSMQIYRGMDIGTAKAGADECSAPLLMVDVADPFENYSCACFQSDARAVIDDLLGQGRTPVLCGGTGLYLDAVIDEMEFPKGEVEDERRSAYEELAEREGGQAVWELLRERDAASAEAIHPNNVRRVVRALEMLDEGTSYAGQLETLKTRKPHYDARIFAVVRERNRLYERIDERVDAMFEAGLVSEVEALLGRGRSLSKTAAQAIGYKEVIDAIEGRATMDEARELIKRRTRRYAKRQLSWLKRDGRATELDLDEMSLEAAVAIIVAAMRKE
jgi:tRNA dimethylallyltransferase